MSFKKKIVTPKPIQTFFGLYPVSSLFNFPEELTQPVFARVGGTVNKNEFMVKIVINDVDVNTGYVSVEGFTTKGIKLAVINMIGVLYNAVNPNFTATNSWALSHKGIGSLLLKSIKATEKPEIEPEFVSAKFDAQQVEQTVLDQIKEDVLMKGEDNVTPLTKATKFYQPILGTSSGSRYVYIGHHKNMKMAMRVLSKSSGSVKVSIRVSDKTGIAPTDTSLELLGLVSSGAHSSNHFTCYDKVTMDRFMVYFNGCLKDWKLCDMNIETIKGLSI